MALAIDNAREVMDLIFTAVKLAGGSVSTEQGTAIALAYASIAQTEQLKRIADALYSTSRPQDSAVSVADSLDEITIHGVAILRLPEDQ